MNIKTITCHNVYNYGASLQAYALQHYLETKGNNVEIIDFQPHFHTYRYNILFVSPRSKYYNLAKKCYPFALFFGLIKNYKIFETYGRKRAFDHFRKDYLHITKLRYDTSDELRSNPPKADLYIAGSDQIWNTDSNNGKEPAYYLDFGDDNVKRASYAASFAVSEVEFAFKNFVKEKVSRLDYISVREKTGVSILENLGITNVNHVIDPVFLLNRDQWYQLAKQAKKYKLPSDGYILLYDFIGDYKIEGFAKMYAEKFDLKIVSVNDFKACKYADINIDNAGPLEFIDLINKATIVISNSFHATAFSTILNKEFYVFSLSTQKNSSRMSDFLTTLDCMTRFNPTTISDRMIDYSIVAKQLQKDIIDSKDYLRLITNII